MTRPTLDLTINFLSTLDTLKTIERKCYVGGGRRHENAAEHSWHLAMACWNFSQWLNDDFDLLKLLQLALIHDLGELEAGDTFLYSADRPSANLKERQCIETLQLDHGNHIQEFSALWDEQELGNSKEAQLIKAMDRLLPFLLNLNNQGKPWIEHNIHRDQVTHAHAFIEDSFPDLHQWLQGKIQFAVDQGWLRTDG